jgi:hypothetical protein
MEQIYADYSFVLRVLMNFATSGNKGGNGADIALVTTVALQAQLVSTNR